MGSCYAINLVRTALDEGFVYIHTSGGYGERNHERLLGEVFRDRPRDTFVIGTSPDLPYPYARGRSRSLDLGTSVDPKRITASIDGSLQRLGLDYIDIYYLLSIGRREAVLFEPYMEAYEKLKKDGKIRFAGIGTHENEPEVIRAAAGSGFWDVVLTAYNFRQSHRDEIRAALESAAEAGLGVVAMKTQAGVYWDRTRLRKINMKAALKWVLQDENVHTAIPAFSTFEEMAEDLSVMKNPALTPEEIRDLRLDEPVRISGLYCQQCRRCVGQCRAGMDIPTLMRGYMYAFGHEAPKTARQKLSAWTPEDVACRDCAVCPVRCVQGFDVRSRALDMAQLLAVPKDFWDRRDAPA
jgi:predicted aldo/keto reductase-like oxidoreductase